MPVASTSLEQILPRLVSAYDHGILVPFLGAGMSMNLSPDWAALINALEGPDASTRRKSRAPQEPAVMIQRANAAIRLLTMRAATERSERMRGALYTRMPKARRNVTREEPLPQTAALAQLKWPLVISSNYDDHFACAYREQRKTEYDGTLAYAEAAPQELREKDDEGYLDVRGRSRMHCAEVLNSLSVTVPTILWAIHGYLPRVPVPSLEPLEREMVVGHDEYRRLAHADPYYRRTFGEVWRRRSLLFLGSSLGDPHLLELFSEIQEIYGSTPQPHFALVGPDSRIDTEHLRTRFNILVARLDTFDELPRALDQLAGLIKAPHPRQLQWRWKLGGGTDGNGTSADLTIVHGALPRDVLAPDEGMLVSAGVGVDSRGDEAPYLHTSIHDVVRDASGTKRLALPPFAMSSRGFFTLPGTRVCAIQPWRDALTRDLTLIPTQLQTAFDWAAAQKVSNLRMSLVGAGSSRHFAAVVPLTLVIRAFRAWRLADSGRTLSISIYVLDQDAIFELRSGRLDGSELLSAQDIRIWVRVVAPGVENVLPEPLYVVEDTTLLSIARSLGLPAPELWQSIISPAAVADDVSLRMNSTLTLAALGVVPGATVTVRRDAN